MYKDIKYFSGLNALRFFAAYFVVMHHAEQIRMKYGMFDLKSFSPFNNGGMAVTFFFVLSGFLITYLLLKEQREKNDISVKKFYVRRILRIWPLYFLLVFLGAVVVPFVLDYINNPYVMPYEFGDVILYYVFFAPFMVNIFFGHHLLEPLWSIGVEELFYIMWAPLFKFLKKHVLKIILGVIFIKIALLIFFEVYNVPEIYVQVANMLKFEAMAIGGLSAYIIFNRKEKIERSFMFSSPIQVIILLFICLRLFAFQFLQENNVIAEFLFSSFLFSNLLLIVLFAWLIVNVAVNPKAILKFENRTLNFLGEISYGIYMYHMLVVFMITLLLKPILNSLGDTSGTVVFYMLLTVSVVIVSFLSKKFFEDRFLRLKRKFK